MEKVVVPLVSEPQSFERGQIKLLREAINFFELPKGERRRPKSRERLQLIMEAITSNFAREIMEKEESSDAFTIALEGEP